MTWFLWAGCLLVTGKNTTPIRLAANLPLLDQGGAGVPQHNCDFNFKKLPVLLFEVGFFYIYITSPLAASCLPLSIWRGGKCLNSLFWFLMMPIVNGTTNDHFEVVIPGMTRHLVNVTRIIVGSMQPI